MLEWRSRWTMMTAGDTDSGVDCGRWRRCWWHSGRRNKRGGGGWEHRRMWQFGRLAESRGRARGLGRWVGEWVPASGGGRPRLSCVGYRATGEGLLPRGTGAGKAHLGDMTPETAPCLCVLLGDRVLS